jgi:hypothetical protein
MEAWWHTGEVSLKSASLHKTLRYVLGVGTIGYAVLSLVQSKRVAEITNMEEEAIQELAKRDVASGLAILTATPPTMALVSRAFYDFGDGAKLMRTRPSVAPLAFAWGLLAIVAILTRPRGAAVGD